MILKNQKNGIIYFCKKISKKIDNWHTKEIIYAFKVIAAKHTELYQYKILIPNKTQIIILKDIN